ncbi:adenylosuccinate lyase [Herbiconiux sp. L3-i23]|uniref:adenylosuccinate lyase n=1 Tax=Herbiconiux sp. L3-i23 TaxID=2905871 RepID=UPI00206796BD|nr:adenylosuccinate lyase [Herbiconiux sp. L3-i23]BDI24184.1 adenylosuccinate lyase [Herbiconiux sp. L3-i23]
MAAPVHPSSAPHDDAAGLRGQPLSPLDGRYRPAVDGLGAFLSEAGLNRARVHVEVEWLIFLTDNGLFGTTRLTEDQSRSLRATVTGFGAADIAELAEFEATTRHDVKAVEYYVRRRLDALGLGAIAELTHFAATSEDVNNLAYAITVQQAVREVWRPAFVDVLEKLRALAVQHRAAPMLARTHGQPATPTTMGKELAVFAHRLDRQLARLDSQDYLGKFNGATGTYAAHLSAGPDLDWPELSRRFVTSLGLEWNPLTTQIESHDWQAELYGTLVHIGRILHNLCTDVWTYISLGYFRQIPVAGATGSSTMPHKVNPIRFENAEANLELSAAVLESLASTLVTSRLQRDLTDSTTQRNIGVGLGHSLLALDNIGRGLGEIALAPDVLAADLDRNWEVLAEAIQTVIRAEVTAGRSTIANPYELLKELTRGRRVDSAALAEFVGGLDLTDEAKARLTALTPEGYAGLADALVDVIRRD